MRTRVKYCGITRKIDAHRAAELGADAIGLVFHANSPRYVSIHQACEIIDVLPPFISVVGLFVNASQDEITRILNAVPIDILQFHGDEFPTDCGRYGRPFIKALRMREGVDVAAYGRTYAQASGLLLDTYQKGVPGGTGTAFDWSWVPQRIEKPLILAGGLRPSNVAEAIAKVRPYGVDVSGGVESEKGIKDIEKMTAFMQEVRHVETS